MTTLLDKLKTAEFLGISVRTVDSLRKKGLPYSLIGGQVRFSESEISEWVQAQKPHTPAGTQEGGNDGTAK